MAESSPLRRRMIEDMTIRNLSPATQRSYIHAVAKFSRYFGHSPDRLGLEDVRAFQVQLVTQGISWPALNQTVCALRFFYGVTLGLETIPERITYAREPRKLPIVLNADEVVRFLEAVPSLKTRAALTTAYAAGLRASEAVSLKVADIDSGRMVIRVEHGKGGKDRTVMLSAQLLAILRTYWRLARPQHWLFPGRDETKPLDVQVLHAACRSACAAESALAFAAARFGLRAEPIPALSRNACSRSLVFVGAGAFFFGRGPPFDLRFDELGYRFLVAVVEGLGVKRAFLRIDDVLGEVEHLPFDLYIRQLLEGFL